LADQILGHMIKPEKNNYFCDLDMDRIRGYLVLLDIDGTLVYDNGHKISPEAARALRKLQKNNQVWLCSNNRDHLRTHNLAVEHNTLRLTSRLRKPSKRILDELKNPDNRPLLVIGDKVMPDMVFARRIGAEFIKVRCLRARSDRGFVTLAYWLDDLLESLIRLVAGKRR